MIDRSAVLWSLPICIWAFIFTFDWQTPQK